MGIPAYFNTIIKKYPDIIQKFIYNKIKVDNFYLDANSIIYDIIYDMENIKYDNITKHIIDNVIIKIEYYIEQINPINIVFIAFDGVCPYAKMKQQRERRNKSIFLDKIYKNIVNKTKNNIFNTISITPGTLFMQECCSTIKSYFENNKNIIVSGSDQYGEGEQKIFEYIRLYPDIHFNKNNVIFGLDADLIILSLNHIYIKNKDINLFLYREMTYFKQDIPPLQNKYMCLLDINKLAKSIIYTMKHTNDYDNNSIKDYIFLTFLLGNDFLPHFPSINIRNNGMDILLDIYKNILGEKNKYIIYNNTIIWSNFYIFINEIVKKEEYYYKEQHKNRDKKEKYWIDDTTNEKKYKKFELLPTYQREQEKYINPYKNGWKYRYYSILFDMDITENKKKQICNNYLDMLEWNYNYYNDVCQDWRIKYNYYYPPLFEDLLKYIPILDNNNRIKKRKETKPFHPIVQLIYVLPKTYLTLLPEYIYNKVVLEYPEWYDEEPKFLWCYKKYFWESHIILPDIDIEKIEIFLNTINK